MLTLYINLNHRTDRRKQAEAEFKKVGISPTRVSGVVHEIPYLGFNQAVLKCMRMAEGSSLLLMEDDVCFDDKLPVIPMVDSLSIHFGCNINGSWQMPEKHNDQLALLHNCWQSHCTWYSKECIDYILTHYKGDIIFDEWFRLNVLPMQRSYVTIPMVAYQRTSHSDIWNRLAEYEGTHRKGNKYLASL